MAGSSSTARRYCCSGRPSSTPTAATTSTAASTIRRLHLALLLAAALCLLQEQSVAAARTQPGSWSALTTAASTPGPAAPDEVSEGSGAVVTPVDSQLDGLPLADRSPIRHHFQHRRPAVHSQVVSRRVVPILLRGVQIDMYTDDVVRWAEQGDPDRQLQQGAKHSAARFSAKPGPVQCTGTIPGSCRP